MIEPNKIMLIGESWTEADEKAGKPLVGTAGRILDGILNEVGLDRSACYVTCVVNERPAGDDFTTYYEGKKPSAKLQECYAQLHDRTAAIRPNLIVTLGPEATKAVAGVEYGAIQHWRGSILETPHGKCLPTIHPSAVLREWLFRPTVVADFTRAKEQMQFPEVQRRDRELVVSYNFDEVMNHLNRLKGATHVSFDIETETEQITCIGFSDRLDWAICIPFWFGSSGSLWSAEQELRLWETIREILESSEIKKIGQNGSYDIEFLRRTMSINVREYEWDTMLMFHCLYAELPKGLDYLVSIYTDHPYYKFGRRATTMDEHFRYNATDACLTFECYQHIQRELVSEGLVDFYSMYIHALVDPLLDMQERGIRFDNAKRDELRRVYRDKVDGLQLELEALVGRELNINSPKQMKEWLYGATTEGNLGLGTRTKKRKATGEETVAADEEALEALYKETGNEAIKKVLEIRELKKVLSTYLEVKLDDDGRIRCSYLIHGTETGRLSSRATARGTGTNLQNIPGGDVKRLFLPDEGYVLVNADLSQAEARVVAYLSGDERFIRVFESGGDIHRKNAANIFNIKEEEVNDEQRQLAKRVVHASNYGMGPVTFAKQIGVTKADAQRLLNRYFATYPRIKGWHRAVADELSRKRALTTPFGRRRTFFNRFGDGLVKEGLAFVPQSTVAEIVNQAIIELHEEGFEILMQVHDSIVVQVRESKLQEDIDAIRKAMLRTVNINGRDLVIPVDVKIGNNWQDMQKPVFQPASA